MQTELVCVFGIRGSGKTTWIRDYTQKLPRIIYYDFLGNFDKAVTIHDWASLKDYFVKDIPPRFRLSFRPVNDQVVFPLVCLLVWHLGRISPHDIYFVIDEIDRYCGPSWEPPEFRQLIAQGRNYGIHTIVATRTPAEISKLITSQASKFVCFTMHEKRHLDYLASQGLGPKAYTLQHRRFFDPIIHEFGGSQMGESEPSTPDADSETVESDEDSVLEPDEDSE